MKMRKLFLILMLLSTSCVASPWECIDSGVLCGTWRMKVPHGWLVKVAGAGTAITFFEDETHDWKL